jgi:hypothetical protein
VPGMLTPVERKGSDQWIPVREALAACWPNRPGSERRLVREGQRLYDPGFRGPDPTSRVVGQSSLRVRGPSAAPQKFVEGVEQAAADRLRLRSPARSRASSWEPAGSLLGSMLSCSWRHGGECGCVLNRSDGKWTG